MFVRVSAGTSHTTTPFSLTLIILSFVTLPIFTASIFHFFSTSSASFSLPFFRMASILSCDSDRRISYGVMRFSLCGTSDTSISMPVPLLVAVSHEEHVRPAAPISCMPATSPFSINSRHAFLRRFPSSGSPMATALFDELDSSVISLEAKLAPPTPSLPVAPPM